MLACGTVDGVNDTWCDMHVPHDTRSTILRRLIRIPPIIMDDYDILYLFIY